MNWLPHKYNVDHITSSKKYIYTVSLFMSILCLSFSNVSQADNTTKTFSQKDTTFGIQSINYQPTLENVQLRTFNTANKPIQMIDLPEVSSFLGYASIHNESDTNGSVVDSKKDSIIALEKIGFNNVSTNDTIKNNANIAIVKPFIPLIEKQISAELLSNARQSSKKVVNTKEISVIPAFSILIDTGIRQLNDNQLTNAEITFTQAQRILPKSAQVYFYLSQTALKKQHPIDAEEFSRRGLTLTKDKKQKELFWQLILESARIQENKMTITEAQKALQ